MVNPSEAARLLASLRRPKLLVCPECGKQFEGRGRRKYCSPSCARRYQSREYYRRSRERLKAKHPRQGYWKEYYRRNREKILARRRARSAASGAGE